MTKVIATNASPKMENRNTAQMLTLFLDGIKKAGASVKLSYAKRLNVKPCMGEVHCWNKRPGVCYSRELA